MAEPLWTLCTGNFSLGGPPTESDGSGLKIPLTPGVSVRTSHQSEGVYLDSALEGGSGLGVQHPGGASHWPVVLWFDDNEVTGTSRKNLGMRGAGVGALVQNSSPSAH